MKKILSTLSALFIFSITFSQGTWEAATVKAYMDNCVPEAEKSLGRADAIEYCNCTRLKLEVRYPDAADLKDLTETEINELAKLCLAEMSDDNSSSGTGKTNTTTTTNTSNGPQPPRPPGPASSSTVKTEKTGATNWSQAAYDSFINSCVDTAKESLGEAEAKTYCSCAGQKLQVLYPDENKLGDIPNEVIQKVANECLGN